jgi:thiol-disulfide isomerase/thioredoxin
MNIVNQYSYVIGSVIVFGAVLYVLRGLLRARRLVILPVQLGVAALLIGGWLVLRPGVSDVDSAQVAESMIESSGKPTFMEFFSNYCVACVGLRPAVDALVAKIKDQYNILRIDIHTDAGRELRKRYGFSFTPEFVFFDGQGEELWRAHLPPSEDQLHILLTPTP